jgi:hypothetical protein
MKQKCRLRQQRRAVYLIDRRPNNFVRFLVGAGCGSGGTVGRCGSNRYTFLRTAILTLIAIHLAAYAVFFFIEFALLAFGDVTTMGCGISFLLTANGGFFAFQFLSLFISKLAVFFSSFGAVVETLVTTIYFGAARVIFLPITVVAEAGAAAARDRIMALSAIAENFINTPFL